MLTLHKSKLTVIFLTLRKLKTNGCFSNFGQVKNWSYSKTFLGETGCLSNFLGQHHASSTPPWLLRPVKVSTSFELYPNYFWLPIPLHCSSTQFFWFNFFSTQSVRLPLFIYPSLCSTSVTYRVPCHVSGHQMLPTLPLPRGVDNFPRGGKYSKHVLLLTYLAWLQAIANNSRLIFNRVKIKNVLLVVKI